MWEWSYCCAEHLRPAFYMKWRGRGGQMISLEDKVVHGVAARPMCSSEKQRSGTNEDAASADRPAE
jgi:hypothetical protein